MAIQIHQKNRICHSVSKMSEIIKNAFTSKTIVILLQENYDTNRRKNVCIFLLPVSIFSYLSSLVCSSDSWSDSSSGKDI